MCTHDGAANLKVCAGDMEFRDSLHFGLCQHFDVALQLLGLIRVD